MSQASQALNSLRSADWQTVATGTSVVLLFVYYIAERFSKKELPAQCQYMEFYQTWFYVFLLLSILGAWSFANSELKMVQQGGNLLVVLLLVGVVMLMFNLMA